MTEPPRLATTSALTGLASQRPQHKAATTHARWFRRGWGTFSVSCSAGTCISASCAAIAAATRAQDDVYLSQHSPSAKHTRGPLGPVGFKLGTPSRETPGSNGCSLCCRSRTTLRRASRESRPFDPSTNHGTQESDSGESVAPVLNLVLFPAKKTVCVWLDGKTRYVTKFGHVPGQNQFFGRDTDI